MKTKLQSSSGREREFLFTEENFKQISKLIYEHAGISLKAAKQDMVYSRLARRLRANGVDNFQDYLTLLENNNELEWEAFVNALTTNLTSFFREVHHFPLLAEHVTGQLARQNKRHPIALWCSAASTGEEPYSMAMTVVDAFGSFTPPVTIVASDLDTHVLAIAEAGVYPIESIEKLSDEKVKRFFLRGTGTQSGYVRVRPELRNLVSFRQVNLLGSNWAISPPLDAIFCRNVMIYFDKATQLGILERFVPLLQPEGLLFAGHSESFQNATHLFKLRGKTVYELVATKSQPHAKAEKS